jgi:uncharacterized RDD family membrane protein YckC
MQWYYVVNGERLGPVSDEQLEALVQQGAINARTLVWKQGMPDWLPLEEVRAGPTTWCDMCGLQVPEGDTLTLKGHRICSRCKPIAVERIREGLPLVEGGSLPYAGFWIRFAAKFIDGIILSVFNNIVTAFLGVGAFQQYGSGPQDPQMVAQEMTSAMLLAQLIIFTASCAYNTLFVGAYGGTPGKLLCGLRIVRPDGSKVTYLRAFGRFWAEWVSALTLLIGYIMAAFDDEKRALHDRIASTRVIHVKKG